MATQKKIRSSPLLGVVARLAIRALAALPIGLARGVGAACGRLCAAVPNRLRRITRLNLSWCFPELPADERRRLLRRSLIETFKFYSEAGALLCWPPVKLDRLIGATEGGELLDASLAGGKGAVLLLPHLGNWELFNHYLMSRHPFSALYRPPRVAELERFLLAARERTGCTMVPATASGLRQLYRELEAGKLVLILPDQEPVRSSGVFAPFFGVSALTMILVARLLGRFGSPALVGWATRERDGRFTLHFREAGADLADPDPVAAATALNREVEECVRERPEQYLWSYKRFKSRPPEEEHRLRELGDATGVKLYRRRP